MQKNRFNHIWTITICFCAALFFSCTNFLEGAELSRKINESIEYNKMPSFSIKILPEFPDMGTVTGNSERIVKVSDELNLNFELNSNYFFDCWKVFIDGQPDENSEYIKIFSPEEKATKIKILKSAENILIRPVCSQYLKVVGVHPEWTSIVPYDTQIIATFNDNIPLSNFRFNEEELEALGFYEGENENKKLASYVKLFTNAKGECYGYQLYDETESITFKNIKISCDSQNYLQHFSAPMIKDNVLTISINYENLFTFSNEMTKTISVTIEDKIISESGSPLIAEKNFIYKVNRSSQSDSDFNPPNHFEISASKNSSALENMEYFIFSTQEEFENFSDDEIKQNIVSGDFSFTARADDRETGIKTIKITETFIKNQDGSDVIFYNETEPWTVPAQYYEYSEDGLSVTTNATYKIQGKNEGAYLINIWAEDFNDNKSETKSFIVVTNRFTSLDEWKLSNTKNKPGNQYDDSTLNEFYLETPPSTIYKNVKETSDFEIYYSYDFENFEKKLDKSSIKNTDTNKYTFTFDEKIMSGVFDDKTVYLKVIADENLPKSNFFIMTIPCKTTVSNYYSKLEYSNFANNSSAYKAYTYHINLYSAGSGMKFCFKNGEPFLTPVLSTSAIKYYGNYLGVVSSTTEYFSLGSFYESEHGYIITKRNDITISTSNYANTLETKDEYGNPISYEVEKSGTYGNFLRMKIKVSGLIPARDKSKGDYAHWMFRIGNNFYSFEGTEHTILVPIADSNKTEISLTAITPSASETLVQNTNTDDIRWYIPDIIEYNHPGNTGIYVDGLRRSCCGENLDFTGDTIRIMPPEFNTDTDKNLKFNNSSKLYYKKMTNAESDFLNNNVTNITVNTNTSNGMIFKRRNPQNFITDKQFELSDVKNFDYIDINTEIKFSSSNDGTYYLAQDCWMANIRNLENGDYMMFLELTTADDKFYYGSFCYKKMKSSHIINSDNISISGTTVTATLPKHWTDNSADCELARIQIDALTENKWVKSCSAELYNPIDENSWFKLTTDETKNLTLEKTSLFMKVYLHELFYDIPLPYFGSSSVYAFHGVDDFYHHAPVYIYPNGSLNPDTQCDVKNIIEGKALTIMCDKPALIQTFCSPVNYGEDSEGLEKWEYYTSKEQVLNPVIINSSKNYEVPVNDIPKGWYYIVIARFSDGTVLSSSVQNVN